MKLNVMLDAGAKLPKKAHDNDAGFDLFIPEDKFITSQITISAHDSIVIDTGVHIEIPEGYVGMVKSKSGLNVKSGINCEGVIDSGYTGSIMVKAYNHSDKDVVLERGDKITQLVIMPIPRIKNKDLCIVDYFADTERGTGGFGSTGR